MVSNNMDNRFILLIYFFFFYEYGVLIEGNFTNSYQYCFENKKQEFLKTFLSNVKHTFYCYEVYLH